MRARALSRTAGLAAFALLGSACSTPLVWVEQTESFRVENLERTKSLNARTHNGRIHCVAAEDARLAVEVVKHAGGADEIDARDALDAIELVRELRGETLHLGWRWRDGHRESSWGARVDFAVEMPSALGVVAHTHNGDIVLDGLGGPCRVDTHNGDVRLHVLGDIVAAETHNGDIVVVAESEAPNANLETHNGNIELAMPAEASARFACRTHNGSIRTAMPVRDAEHGRRSLRGTLGDGEGEITIRTHNGSIRLR